MIYLNGQLVAEPKAHINTTDRGFTLGDGLFETICVKNATPLRIDAHLARLKQGAEILSIALPYSAETLKNQVIDLLKAKGLSDAVVRLMVTRGPADRGLWPVKGASPTVMISANPASHGELSPQDAWVVKATRRNHQSPLARCKSMNYGDSLLAAIEAGRHGAMVAILKNTEDQLAETATGNLFVVFQDFLITPPVSEGALPGIMRQAVLDEFGAYEEPMGAEDLSRATEIFATNALGIQPVRCLNGEPLNPSAPGPVTQRVIQALQP